MRHHRWSVQPALRNFIETFTKIVDLSTCNYKNKILPALLVVTVIDFAIKNGQKVKTAQALLKRAKS